MMKRSSLQKRSARHRRRGLHLPRAETIIPKVLDVTPNPKAAAPAPVADRPKETTTPILPPAPVVPVIASLALSPVLGPSTTATPSPTSSTTSTTETLATPSAIISSLRTTRGTPTATTPTTLPRIIVYTTTSLSSMSTQTPSTTAQADSGMSTSTVIGGIGGALAGTLLLTVIIAFLLRRYRKNKANKSAFDANQFRRSAVLLDEKEDNTCYGPRPPTMIERRNLAPIVPVSSPPVVYPYSDEPPILSSAPLLGNEHAQAFTQHGVNQVQYGAVPLQPSSFAGNQFGGNGGAPAMHYGTNAYAIDYGQGDPFAAFAALGHEQPGYGAPPVPGTHGPGAYAPYGVDPRYPQYQRHPCHQQYPHQHAQQHQQHGFGQCSTVDTASGTSLTRQETVSSLANPFSPPLVPTKTWPTEVSSSVPISTSIPSSLNTELGRRASFLTRQSQELPPAYSNKAAYTDVKRAVKLSPSTSSPSLHIVNDNSDSGMPDTRAVDMATIQWKAPELRPLSLYTLYNDDDAYGGM